MWENEGEKEEKKKKATIKERSGEKGSRCGGKKKKSVFLERNPTQLFLPCKKKRLQNSLNQPQTSQEKFTETDNILFWF